MSDLVAALRHDLLAADYTVDAITETLGPDASRALDRDELAPALWVLDQAPATAQASLTRLFLLGREVAAREVAAAVPECGLAGLVELGLVQEAGGYVRAELDVRPCGQADPDQASWVVSDLGEAVTGATLATDHVLGIGQASLTLAVATIRRPSRDTLDLGTGCGVQALHAIRHSERVVATDVDPRAVHLAELGFGLSGAQIELRCGDLFEPVAGEGFDLVVTNPPFVITPRGRGLPEYTYRDGGRTGDALMGELFSQVGAHLRPGGIAQALGNWEVTEGSDWTTRVQEWLTRALDRDGRPLDAWIIQRELLSPADYATLWARDAGAAGADRDDLVRAWLDDFAERGVTAIGLGLVLLRRPGPGTRVLRRLEHRPEPLEPTDHSLGAHLDGCLRAHDASADMAGQRLVVSDDVVEERRHRPGQGEPTSIVLRQTSGFGRTIGVDTATAAFVGACDGELTVAQIGAALAQLLDVDADRLVTSLAEQAGELVLDGFLTPAALRES